MAERIVNPRRMPRAPARCEARGVLEGGGFWTSDVIDIGPSGCQLTAPGRSSPGDPLRLLITNERVTEALAVTGRVAWFRMSTTPWRLGVAFDADSLADAGRWFEALVAAYPGLATYRQAPDAIDVDGTLRLGPAPRLPPELSVDELEIMRAVGKGTSPAALRARLGADWPAFEGQLFAMIGRRLLTLDPAAAAPLEAWAGVLKAR